MTTNEMKLALLCHFRWRLRYPIVVTECPIGSCLADVLAIRKMMVEVEVKRSFAEVRQDLKKKWIKHESYLRPLKAPTTHYLERRPNMFYFALPADCFSPPSQWEKMEKEMPLQYGLIAIKELYHCRRIKPALYLTRLDQTDGWREVLMARLTSENIDLRLKLRDVCDKSP